MRKPVDLDELLLRVRALLRRANIEMERKLSSGNLKMDEFWGMDSETSLRAVDVYITRLRDKFSGCDGFKVVTVRGLGYKAVVK